MRKVAPGEREDEAAVLTFPFSKAPQPGEAQNIAPGVWWLRMPLPFALEHINVWALWDHDGWTIVDTGLQSSETAAAWRSALAGPLERKPIKRVIVTHMHPDHVGMAGWLTRRFDCRLWMTRLEYLTCRMLVADTGREAPPEGLRFYRATGWDDEAIEYYRARFGQFGKGVYSLPGSYRRVVDGEEIEINGVIWRAVVGCGHSPEHLCLYSPELALMISGDQVLPRISSNVSVFPTEPDADPLADWLRSLASVKRKVPNDVLVLPAHHDPFKGLHPRIDALTSGHERRLERLSRALAEPKRVVDLFPSLFRGTIKNDELIMATGETLSHLNYLVHRGQVSRRTDADGIDWYQAVPHAGERQS